jgi:hypothetical protein
VNGQETETIKPKEGKKMTGPLMPTAHPQIRNGTVKEELTQVLILKLSVRLGHVKEDIVKNTGSMVLVLCSVLFACVCVCVCVLAITTTKPH